MSDRNVRIGIDVGGTFTHGVALDAKTLEIVASSCVPTTHRADSGVAEGVGRCLEEILRGAGLKPEQVTTVAHSTTQATNALLEGDVVAVGLVGITGGVAGWRARRELRFRSVKIGGGHEVKVFPNFCPIDELDSVVPARLDELSQGNISALVAAQAFSIENPAGELKVIEKAAEKGFTATGTHQISGLYGLRSRTRTAIVNAAILPKMMDAANRTHESMLRMGVTAPLLIMRSDGGVMRAARVRVRPIETLLSGPAAGISAAILHERLAAGLFVEVGGTSTDISIVLNGKPMRKNAVVGDHALHLKTLDVRTAGVAGGSMPRISRGRIIEVGPRSAHIAALPYACFTDPAELEGATVETIAPLPGDPPDYAVLKTASGRRVAITNTCAANFKGIIPAGDYATGNAESARLAFAALARATGGQEDRLAKAMIRLSVSKLHRRCKALIAEYDCGDDITLMVGGGGGAGVLVPSLARRLNLRYRQARNAELVSAIGAAMALTKSTVERSVVNPTEEDLRRARSEAAQALVDQGCDPDTIEVQVEVDARRNLVVAEAEGAFTLAAGRSLTRIKAGDAVRIALEEIPDAIERPKVAFEDSGAFVLSFRRKPASKKEEQVTIVIDSGGLVKLVQRESDALIIESGDREKTAEAVRSGLHYSDGGVAVRPMHMACGGRVIDLSRIGDAGRIEKVIEMEMAENPACERFCLIVARG
ncbi:MAG: hydantoinase/oxoprolinase family protein [bacterium]